MKKLTIFVVAFSTLFLSGCSYSAYWAGHDIGATVSPSEKDILDMETACQDWSYNDGYPDNPDYLQGCYDAWEGK